MDKALNQNFRYFFIKKYVAINLYISFSRRELSTRVFALWKFSIFEIIFVFVRGIYCTTNANIRFRNPRSLSDKKNRASAIYRPTFGDRNTRRTPFTIYAMHLKSNSSVHSHLPTRGFLFFKLTFQSYVIPRRIARDA